MTETERKESVMKILLKSVAIAAMSIAMLAQAHAASDPDKQDTMPDDLKGSWCFAGEFKNHGTPATAFSRGECKNKNGATLTYTTFGRFVKVGSNPPGECRLDEAEATGRGGWFVRFTCAGMRLEEFVYPMTNNRLGVMTQAVEPK
jgi:hypothetical protein